MKKLNLTNKQKNKLTRIIISLCIFIVLFVCSRLINIKSADNQLIAWLLPCLIWLALYLYIGYDVIISAIKNMFRGNVFDENFLMLVATVGAFVLGVINSISSSNPEGFDEAVAVLLFYQVGQFFESFATEKSRKSISDLLDIRPDYANLLKEEGVERVFPEEIKIGDRIVIYPGEKIPLDCVVESGNSVIDNKALTGESMPVNVEEGTSLLSGAVNLTSQLTCVVVKEFYDSTVNKILDLVESASDKKSKSENFIARFAKYYTPTVIILALIVAIVPSVITGDYNVWIYRALSFLVVSCPCALVISVPMTFFVALGKSSREGVLVKGSNYLEALANANYFIFDKTGTITTGNFKVTEVYPPEKREEILDIACIAEQNSSHPIAKSILQERPNFVESGYTLTNFAGFGVMATNENTAILCGNKSFLENNGISVPIEENGAVLVAKNGEFVGYIVVEDQVKSEVNGVIGSLLDQKCKVIMLTGDSEKTAKRVAEKCNITSYKANLLPQDKVTQVEQTILNKNEKDIVCFVGDGINDAPVLMRSDLGIAMGAIGSDAAIEAADVVLMRDSLTDMINAKKIAKKAIRIVRQNIIFSLTVKIAILILSLFGITNMWFSIFGDVGVAMLAIFNALRVDK